MAMLCGADAGLDVTDGVYSHVTSVTNCRDQRFEP